MKAIRVYQPGGPEVLKYEEVETPNPGPGEALVEIEVSGVNFIDTYHREGLYKLDLPFTIGVEAAGTVRSVGPSVEEVKPGDRVAYALSVGSYATAAVVPSWKLVPLPSTVNFQTGVAAMVQGMTAHYLTHGSYPLGAGQTALIHAAAGGVGLLLVQIAKMLGAHVIGTVSNQAKAELVRQAGADSVIIYTETDFREEVKRWTGGKGLEVVYDSVGKTTLEKSLDCLRPRGYLVLFGQSSGPGLPLDPQVLNDKGSLFLTRPSLVHYAATRQELLSRANDVLGWINSGKLKIRIGKTFSLSEAALAHQALQGRQTTGKVLLIP